MERAIVHGVRISYEQARITVAGVAQHPGTAARVFRAVARAGAVVGAIAQHPGPAPNRVDITFTVPAGVAPAVASALHAAGFDRVVDQAAEVTLAGVGLRADAGVVAVFGEALAMAGVPISLLSIEGTGISAICERNRVVAAARGLCEAFEVGVLDPVIAC